MCGGMGEWVGGGAYRAVGDHVRFEFEVNAHLPKQLHGPLRLSALGAGVDGRVEGHDVRRYDFLSPSTATRPCVALAVTCHVLVVGILRIALVAAVAVQRGVDDGVGGVGERVAVQLFHVFQ